MAPEGGATGTSASVWPSSAAARIALVELCLVCWRSFLKISRMANSNLVEVKDVGRLERDAVDADTVAGKLAL